MQIKRIKYTLKAIKDGAIYIGRGHHQYKIPPSKWRNPFTVKKYGRTKALSMFEDYIRTGSGKHLLNDLEELKDKTICCHCRPDEDCHGDILIRLLKELHPGKK